MVQVPGAKAPAATRRKILDAAFVEFYGYGFQGGSRPTACADYYLESLRP